MRLRASFIVSSLVVLVLGLSGLVNERPSGLANEREGEHRARLTPPEEAPFPDARGSVELNREALILKVEGSAVIATWNDNPPGDKIIGYYLYVSARADGGFRNITSTPLPKPTLRLKAASFKNLL